ncbi:MAG: hypothetical protein E7065_11640 [Lentimicrobiaceae bacterium]|nr:hypothetical protein [Lentimicrobiaceae bacterium]
MFKSFPFFHQYDAMDCGPTCLNMIAQYHGRTFSLEKLRELCRISKEGVSMQGISMAAESLGFKTLGVHIKFHQLKDEVPMPCIVHWKQNHFVVVYRIKRGKVYVADRLSLFGRRSVSPHTCFVFLRPYRTACK